MKARGTSSKIPLDSSTAPKKAYEKTDATACLLYNFAYISTMPMTSFSALTQYTEAPAVKALDLSPAGMENLLIFGEGQRQRYLSSTPFPHLIVDNLFPTALLQDVLQDVKSLDHPIARNAYGSAKEFATPDPQAMGPTARRFLLDLCSARFCLFLEALTGIEGVIPDPHFEGGGVREIARDGFLRMHTGSSWNQKLRLDRRLSMLIYLNPDWDDRWGGHLELWDSEMKNQFIKVPPVFNKTVIFSTTDHSFYGFPNPLICPEDIRRRSLALSYYSNDHYSNGHHSNRHPAAEVQFHQSADTSYQERPGEVFSPRQPAYPAAQPVGRTKKKSGNGVAAPARAVTARVKKTIQKSLPKSLMEIYRAGKRSLRG